jgi:hypothetical protein
MIVNYDRKTFIGQATIHFLSNGNLTHAWLGGALASSQSFMLVALILHEMTKLLILMPKDCQLSFTW